MEYAVCGVKEQVIIMAIVLVMFACLVNCTTNQTYQPKTVKWRKNNQSQRETSVPALKILLWRGLWRSALLCQTGTTWVGWSQLDTFKIWAVVL